MRYINNDNNNNKKTYLLVIALISLSTICKPKRHKIMAAYKIPFSRLSDRRGSA